MTPLASFRHVASRAGPFEEKYERLPDTHQPGTSVTMLFPYQSYFDDTLLQQALLQQSQNEPIVNSASPALGAPTQMVKTNTGGYSFGLHPSSQTPVAVLPLVGGQPASPQPVILKPGQIFRPHGRPGLKAGNFSGLNWGLPFGWLGGGIATLFIFSSPDADVDWPGDDVELIFHRQRMKIADPVALPANAPLNWPVRFPWTQAVRGAGNISQKGQGIVAVEGTRTVMSLRLGALGAAARMRVLYQGTNDLDLDASGTVIATPVRFQDYVWGSYAANGGAGNLGVNYPVVELPSPSIRLSADDGGVQLVDMSGTGALAGQYVDVVRYGRL